MKWIRQKIWLVGFAVVLLVPSTYSEPAANRQNLEWVRNPEEFDHHMKLHIQRVARLGLKLIDLYRADFKGVDPVLLEKFLSLHDQSKVNRSPEFLAHHNISLEEDPIGVQLFYKLYGLKPRAKTLSDSTKNALKDRINLIDARVAKDFFDANGIGEELARLYLMIEKVADLVDRNKCVVTAEEFGGVLPVHKFTDNPLALDYFRNLREHYDEVVKGLEYEAWRASHDPVKCRCPLSQLPGNAAK